jgi:hypothetical protein
MDDLCLNSDEAIIHKTQTLIISGVRHEAVLTSRRLILVESETGHIHEDILFADISLATSGINRIREPFIALNFNSPEGEKRLLELIFIHLTGNGNIREMERCLTILKQNNVPVESKFPSGGPTLLRRGDRADTGDSLGEEPTSRPAVPEWTPLIVIAAAVIILVVFVIGVLVVGQAMTVKNVTASQSVTGADTAGPFVPTPAPTPTPEPDVTSGTDASPPPIRVPTNGIWVQVSYPGNYTGYLGAQGKQIEVNSSGTQFYQLPVQDAMIEGMIEKQDGSAEKLEVGIYNGGILVSKSGTTTPRGVVDIHVMVAGPAIGGEVIPTPAPVVQPEITPDASLPPVTIPSSGVWVRISYPGNFTGSVGAKGRLEMINSTGNQLIHVPVTSGMIDGSIEKQDGSDRTLFIEIYKDGTLVTRSASSRPFDLVDIHTNV